MLSFRAMAANVRNMQGPTSDSVRSSPVNPTDVILITTGWGSIPSPAIPGSEGAMCSRVLLLVSAQCVQIVNMLCKHEHWLNVS